MLLRIEKRGYECNRFIPITLKAAIYFSIISLRMFHGCLMKIMAMRVLVVKYGSWYQFEEGGKFNTEAAY